MSARKHPIGSWIMALALSIVLGHAFTPHDHVCPDGREPSVSDLASQPITLFGFDAGADHLSNYTGADQPKLIQSVKIEVTAVACKVVGPSVPFLIATVFPPPDRALTSVYSSGCPCRRGPPLG